MKQFVLINKESGELGIGARVTLFDNVAYENELTKLEGYSVTLRSSDYEGWIVTASDSDPWIYAPKDLVESKLEIVCEL